MDRQVFDRGFTMIEMTFVLTVIIFLTSLTIPKLFDPSSLKFSQLCELLKQAQLSSILNYKQHNISLYDSTLEVNHTSYDLSPLICEPVFFHYNMKGNISHALTIVCHGHHVYYSATLQLGSGWIRYE